MINSYTDALGQAEAFAKSDLATSSRKNYSDDFADFQSWCESCGVSPLPASAETVAGYLAQCAKKGLKASTINRRCVAIRYFHLKSEHQSPTLSGKVKYTLAGIRRVIGTAPIRKSPLIDEFIRAMCDKCPNTLAGFRNRLIFILGQGGFLRRSDLVALNVDDIEETDEGLRITIRRSKTDQESKGEKIRIERRDDAYCPVRALRAWLDAAKITKGAIFRSIRRGGQVRDRRLGVGSVCIFVKTYAKEIGLDPATIGAHSLRHGGLTSAARRGDSIWKMRDRSRLKNMDVLAGYVSDAEPFLDHADARTL